MIAKDFPKLECPFVRVQKPEGYVVTPEINPGYEWVLEHPGVIAVEKLHGTNVSIIVENGQIVSMWNRDKRIPHFNKDKRWIIEGLIESWCRGYIEPLGDGQHFGELIGKNVNGNPYQIEGHLWIPFESYAKDHLRYKSWGKYPKTFEAISEWFKTLMPLFCMKRGDTKGFVEGVIFYHPDGRMAKLRRDMFPFWYLSSRHKSPVEESP